MKEAQMFVEYRESTHLSTSAAADSPLQYHLAMLASQSTQLHVIQPMYIQNDGVVCLHEHHHFECT